MAAVIKLKRGTSTPSTSDIVSGEVAVDTSAAKLYINDSGTVKEIGGGGGGVTSDAQRNTVAGTNAGDSFDGTNPTDNNLFGTNAGTTLTSGDHNNVMGSYALDAATTGYRNQAIGSKALTKLTTGYHNVAIGHDAGENLTTGWKNILIGQYAGFDLTTGQHNTCVGDYAGGNITSAGDDNTCIGQRAGFALNGSNNTLIGHDATVSTWTVSNEVTIGDTNVTKFRVPGLNFVVKDTTATEDYVLTVDANGEAGWEAAAGGTPTAITVADESSDTTCFPLFATAATGDLGPKSGSNLTFNSSSGDLTATLLNGGAGSNLSLDFGSVA